MSTPWFARRRRATQHLWRGRRRPAPRRVVASAQQPRRARRGRPQPPPRGISTCLPPPSRAGPGTDSLLHLRRGTQHDRWRCAMRRAHPDLPCSGRRHVMARRRGATPGRLAVDARRRLAPTRMGAECPSQCHFECGLSRPTIPPDWRPLRQIGSLQPQLHADLCGFGWGFAASFGTVERRRAAARRDVQIMRRSKRSRLMSSCLRTSPRCAVIATKMAMWLAI